MPLQATSGAASYDGFGGGVAAVPNYIEDVFNTYCWTTSASDQTFTTGIDMTKGALTWIKSRSNAYSHVLQTGVGGGVLPNNALSSNNTNAYFGGNYRIAESTTGFTMGTDYYTGTPETAVVWTFRKQPKFFDVVTYTGDGTNNRAIAHSLGSAPGCVIVKSTSNAQNWPVYHRSTGANTIFWLNATNANSASTGYFPTAPDSTSFYVGTDTDVNQSGYTYVAYVFAHNAGGFGLTGTDNVISCGSYTTDGSGNATINLGYEPQWVMIKRTDSTGDWRMMDTMRGLTNDYAAGTMTLLANTSGAESGPASYQSITATGFQNNAYAASATFIYIAIRRGPMKVPTDATTVFSPNQTSGTTGTPITTGFPVDWQLLGINDGNVYNQRSSTRLTGVNTNGTSNSQYLVTSNTIAEGATGSLTLNWNNTGFQVPSLNSGSPIITWNFARAPSFFDEVCYTGDGTSGATQTHNLGVVPELMIVKSRSLGQGWLVYSATIGGTNYLRLNSDVASAASTLPWNDTAPTSTVFTLGTATNVNGSGATYVAYLFATCAGVSKCTAFTGNGSTQTINCGFTSGARFVMIKATSTTGNWTIFDSARGISAGGDPALYLNSTAAEVTGVDAIDADSTGFIVNQEGTFNLNASGVQYLVLAIA